MTSAPPAIPDRLLAQARALIGLEGEWAPEVTDAAILTAWRRGYRSLAGILGSARHILDFEQPDLFG